LKKNILIIASDLPLPVDGGTRLRLYHLFKRLNSEYNFILAVRLRNNEELNSISANLSVFSQIIQIKQDRPDLLRKIGIIFQALIRGIPVKCAAAYFPALVREIKDFANDHPIDVIHYDHTVYGYYYESLKKIASQHLLMVDDIDSRKNYEDYRRVPNLLKKLYYFYEYRTFRKLERELIGKFRNIATVSIANQEFLVKEYQCGEPGLVENGVEIPAIKLKKRTEPGIIRLMCLGNFGYPPNREGVLFFLHSVLPLLAQNRINFQLLIVGKGADAEITKYESDRVRVIGFVEQIVDCYQNCDVMVAPILSGGGTRTKVLEAMGYRTLVVSTTKGCEGLAVKDRESILIADTPSEFMKAIRMAQQQPDLRSQIEENAYKIACEFYNWDSIARKLREIYDALSEGTDDDC
jgi:glycosyltransferase involved in cell wall biosynthesis